jgi:ferritin-like metal-binding protein YciE
MKSIHNYRELALKHLSIMYRSEHQFLVYLQVLSYKANAAKLKGLLFDVKLSSNYKLNYLLQIMRSMKNTHGQAGSEGINGLFKETFKLIDEDSSPALVDATLLHSLILASHYKLGNYKTLLLYFHSLDFHHEADLMQKIIHAEEAVLKRINTLVKEDFLMNTFKPRLEETLV